MWLIPRKAVKSEFIVLVYISIHVPEKSGNYKPPVRFSPLSVLCINVEKNAASVLHLPHCCDCTLRTLRGGGVLLCCDPTHVHIWDLFCLMTAIVDFKHSRNLLCKMIVICRANTLTLCLKVTMFCVTCVFCVDLCVKVCTQMPPLIVVGVNRLRQSMGGHDGWVSLYKELTHHSYNSWRWNGQSLFQASHTHALGMTRSLVGHRQRDWLPTISASEA